ncbi:hypothetical protein Q4596_06375 [Pseudoalteromonas carrageenovora]|uniref:hypothetical protein n=1 Tax=Pseudoalteromonas carrageenovora TaxID=227 RepID=UPI0026E480E6|nr:hypothetical protein [Pseudoalteromonas carrageenovora]MDO6835241.1 hypothetical protein [Pseudoalteromonas carrageenovora]
MRHPAREAIYKFNKLLNLHEDPLMQDWEVECADALRIEEFINCYRTSASTDDERFTLMALILGSFEEYHGLETPKPEVWEKIRYILSTESKLHEDHIEYYSCLETEVPEEWFPITPLIRAV